MFYIAVDTETTGLDPLNCQILEFGAVFADTESETPIGRSFRVIVDNGFQIKGEPYALQMNAHLLHEISLAIGLKNDLDLPLADLEKLNNYLVKPNNLVAVFNKWREEVGALDCRNIGGKNYSSFDGRFLEYVVHWREQGFRHRVLDPSMLWLAPEDEKLPSLKECAIRAGLNVNDERFKLHTAVGDCNLVVACIYKGLHNSVE